MPAFSFWGQFTINASLSVPDPSLATRKVVKGALLNLLHQLFVNSVIFNLQTLRTPILEWSLDKLDQRLNLWNKIQSSLPERIPIFGKPGGEEPSFRSSSHHQACWSLSQGSPSLSVCNSVWRTYVSLWSIYRRGQGWSQIFWFGVYLYIFMYRIGFMSQMKRGNGYLSIVIGESRHLLVLI